MAGHITGKGLKIVWFVDDAKKAPLDFKSMNFGPVLEEIADGVGGEDHDRLDREFKYYQGEMECFNKDTQKLITLLGYDATMNGNTGGTPCSLGFQITDKTGVTIKLAAVEVVIGSWKWTMGGRTDRQMITIPVRWTRTVTQ